MAGQSLADSILPACVWENRVLTHAGSLIGGLTLSGVDPKGIGSADFQKITILIRNIFQALEPGVVISSYYWHFEGAQVSLKRRTDKRSQLLSNRRERFLNSRTLSDVALYWMVEIPQTSNLNKVWGLEFITTLFSAPFDVDARARLKAKFANMRAWLVEIEELMKQKELLDQSLKEMGSRIEFISRQNHVMSKGELWGLCRAVVNANPEYLVTGQLEDVPEYGWESMLLDGDIQPVNVNGLDCLKIDGARPVYVRMASITRYGEASFFDGMWAKGDKKVTLQHGSYFITTRFSQFSNLRKAAMLHSKESDLWRSQMKLSNVLSGETDNSEDTLRVTGSESVKRRMAELDEIANSPDRYGVLTSHVVVFDTDPDKLKNTCSLLHTSLSQSGFRFVWESAGLMKEFPNVFPGNNKKSIRMLEVNTSQAAAASLIFKSADGIRSWGVNNEEAIYILESEDGTLFHYTPFIGEKCLVLGIGPTRSGKTFFKNIVSGHFLKFDSNGTPLYHAVDIDSGSEPLARYFKEQGGIFRLEQFRESAGFNPFVSAVDANDQGFKLHFLSQIRLMVESNDSEELRYLSSDDQHSLDKALFDMMSEMDRSLWSFSQLYNHCNDGLKAKLQRWHRRGMLGAIFDNDVDGIGDLKKPFTAYNLSAVKDNASVAKLVVNEIFFRISRVFEDPRNRTVPKFMEIDEAQYFFSIPGSVEMAVKKARTWFKHNGGMGFWTQNPEHYEAIPEWETLRTSASTWIFCADPGMNRDKYKSAFKLSEGELDAIEALTPRKQVFIIQREAGIAKTVNVIASKEEYVIATSRPHEAAIVQQSLSEYDDIDFAIDDAMKKIFRENEMLS
ncbi:hypothetical protein WH50_06405 [Pokkaliibacter plantistimulans]|uniref:CagE TrbE VirB component of type IV transporter system central domain-containing protein n=1 Tax=Pokkaliibacter plantistimulans TaxID=1635171 RepID=A0ABX5M0K5_9GAMM|nr:VirB4 family type IV secretion system protein [Pokkaliibacter plantistimulans]PXF32086.1 hypothetical protein WH50_06405 [Pokkaliibacter plantistimulans]